MDPGNVRSRLPKHSSEFQGPIYYFWNRVTVNDSHRRTKISPQVNDDDMHDFDWVFLGILARICIVGRLLTCPISQIKNLTHQWFSDSRRIILIVWACGRTGRTFIITGCWACRHCVTVALIIDYVTRLQRVHVRAITSIYWHTWKQSCKKNKVDQRTMIP